MDAITLFLYMFFGFVLLMVILIGIAFLRAILHSSKQAEIRPIAK